MTMGSIVDGRTGASSEDPPAGGQRLLLVPFVFYLVSRNLSAVSQGMQEEATNEIVVE